MPALTLTAKVDGLDQIVVRLETGLFAIAALSRTVKEYAELVRAQAVLNVSGTQVTYSGGTFVVNKVTGKLSQSITVAQVNPLSAIIIATAKYAPYIEDGTEAYDMKPGLLKGRPFAIVPIRASGMGGAHLAQQDGMPTQGPVKGGVRRVKRKNSRKRTSKIDYISFRRITATSKGWLMPARAPRPFMQAAGEKIAPLFTDAVAKVYAKYLTSGA